MSRHTTDDVVGAVETVESRLASIEDTMPTDGQIQAVVNRLDEIAELLREAAGFLQSISAVVESAERLE